MTVTRGLCAPWLTLSVVIVLSLLGDVVVEAQVESGKIVGTVRDSSGAVLADAVVTVTATKTNITRRPTTGANGDYVVTELPSGTYRVTVEHQGLKRAIIGGAVVPVIMDVSVITLACTPDPVFSISPSDLCSLLASGPSPS